MPYHVDMLEAHEVAAALAEAITGAGAGSGAGAKAQLPYSYDLRRASADKIDALARQARPRCSHVGVRSQVRCVRPAGHNGQHRY